MSDWVPTLLSAAGGDGGTDLGAAFDGVDQWGALMAEDPQEEAGARKELLTGLDNSIRGQVTLR